MRTLDDILQQLRDMSQSAREQGDYIDLVKRIVRVSLETNRIVATLPALNERDVVITPR